MLKELTTSKQAEKQGSTTRGYQPIVGTVGTQNTAGSAGGYHRPPQQSSNYGRAGSGDRQTRQDLVCFTCGAHGHRVYECRATKVLPKEEQDRLRTAHIRSQEQARAGANTAADPPVGNMNNSNN